MSWQQLKTLFQGALEQPPADRAAWLGRMASGDDELRREVERLLAAHEAAEGFLESPPAIDSPTHIGPYIIEREIGRGGMGVVYLAQDSRLQRRVAVKMLPAPLTADPPLRERLRREARAAATISHHGIATVFALEELDSELFIVSEYVPGQTLREAMREGPLGVARAIAITRDILHALAAAHAAGVVHRDLKPDNVVLSATGQIKIVDFGIAQIEQADGSRMTREGIALGTLGYAAPEQLAGFGGDARSDLYAAGILLAEMATGRHPLAADAPAIPAAIASVVSGALASEPRQRFQSAQEILAALDTPSAPAASSAQRWWAFHQAAAIVVYSCALIPAWTARELIGGWAGRLVFVAALAGTILSGVLRLHVWFTFRWYAAQLKRVRQRATPAIRTADALLSAALIIGGAMVADTREPLALLLLSLGLGITVAFLAIEPVTTRAAFSGTHRGES